MKSFTRLLMLVVLLTTLVMAGCGDDGSDGADGATGPVGPEGPPGPVTETGESCAVCHSDSSTYDIALYHELGAEYFPLDELTITDATMVDADTLEFTFTVVDDAGDAVPGLAGDFRMTLAKLIPGTGNEMVWQSYFADEEIVAADGAGYPGILPNTETQADSATATFAESATVEGTYTATVDVTFDAGDIDLTNRVSLYYGGHGDPVGTSTVDFVPSALATSWTAAQDSVTDTRNIATIESCNECHGALAGHGGDRITVANCVTCHNPFTTDANSGISVDMPAMIHAIHAGEELTMDYTIWGYRDTPHNYNEVLYPEELINCEKCHTSDDAETPDGDNWKTTPTIAACGACHDDVNFATGEGHSANEYVQVDNANCTLCHPANVIVSYHTPDPEPENVAEFDVAISLSEPANGEYFVAGEEPVVTVTLTAADGGAAVDYTAAEDTDNDRDGILTSADLDVYGPRAHADIVGSASLLLPNDNAQVLTDAEGFKYQLAPIPEDLADGTYMVFFEGGDYGVVSSDDYHTHSTAFITFQVGTATEEAKVAGDCTSCHGDTRIHVEGSHPHNIPYDTDACLACHNYSGGYGTPISQRVHAVHSASGVGADGHGRAWEEITYPQDVAHCQTCHNSGKTTFADFTGDRALACISCHGDDTGVSDHVEQNGGDL